MVSDTWSAHVVCSRGLLTWSAHVVSETCAKGDDSCGGEKKETHHMTLCPIPPPGLGQYPRYPLGVWVWVRVWVRVWVWCG